MCFACKKKFDGDKVRDRCHYTGKYRGALHSGCNLKLGERILIIPVLAHNNSGYDSHMFVKRLADTKGRSGCIAENEEKYITFSKDILVDVVDEEKVYVRLKFLDTFRFMDKSLAELAKTTTKFEHTEKYFTPEQQELLRRKEVYPYDYMTDFSKLAETEPPPREAFNSWLKSAGAVSCTNEFDEMKPVTISDEDYEHFMEMWKRSGSKTLGDLTEFYVKGDTFQLADVFENFIDVCMEKYLLDPSYYFAPTTPHEYTNKNPCLLLPIPSFKDRTCENIDFAPATSKVSIEGIPNFQPIPVRVSYRHDEKIPSRKHNPLNCINIKPVETFINCDFKDSNDQHNVYVSSKSKLKVIHLNARSLKNRVNLHQIREFTQEHKPDIIAISETWLNSTVTNAEIEIECFKVIRLDRLHKIGGGVCAYVRSNIKCFKIKHLSTISEDNFHQLWLRIQFKKLKSFLICLTYRPPDCSLNCFESHFKPAYTEALLMNYPIVILGDLNCNMLNTNNDYKILKGICDELNLNQIIKSPTRVTATTKSPIDIVLVSDITFIKRSGVIKTLISDHYPVFVTLKLNKEKQPPQTITTRSFRNYNTDLFEAEISQYSAILSALLYTSPSVNDQLNSFNNIYETVLENHAPIKNIKIKSRSYPFC